MVEVEVTRFEDTHHLESLCGFTMEGNRGGADELTYQALEGDDIYLEDATVHQTAQTVQQGVHPEQTLGVERGVENRTLRGGYRLGDADEPVEQRLDLDIAFCDDVVREEAGIGMALDTLHPATGELLLA